MVLRRLPLLLVLLSVGAVPGYAQGAQNTPNRHSIFSIGGSIRDEVTHREMESIQVVLMGPTGAPVATAFTRDNGDFQFDGMPYVLRTRARRTR